MGAFAILRLDGINGVFPFEMVVDLVFSPWCEIVFRVLEFTMIHQQKYFPLIVHCLVLICGFRVKVGSQSWSVDGQRQSGVIVTALLKLAMRR